MNAKHQSPAQVSSIYEDPADCNSITETQTKTDGNDSTFLIADSTEMELFPLMSLAGKEDVAMLYIEKGDYDSATRQVTEFLNREPANERARTLLQNLSARRSN